MVLFYHSNFFLFPALSGAYCLMFVLRRFHMAAELIFISIWAEENINERWE